jgi:hypothetical protein
LFRSAIAGVGRFSGRLRRSSKIDVNAGFASGISATRRFVNYRRARERANDFQN